MSILGGGGGRTYGFDLDIIKSPSPTSGRSSSSSSSSPSSAISTKGARSPRKRPNQSYSEAAALLSAVYPNLFSTINLHKLTKPFSSPSPPSLFSLRFEFKPASPRDKSSVEYHDPGSPDSPDYDVESILDEDVGEGIDSIMGNLSMENYSLPNSNPHLETLMGFGCAQALRGAHNGDWWRPTTTVPVGEIVPKFDALLMPEKKKSKKRKKKAEEAAAKDEPRVVAAATTTTPPPAAPAAATTTCSLDVELKSGLGLKLNHEDVLRAWSDRDFPFSNESGTPESSADILARLSDIDLIPDGEAGVRGASVQRYREKRRTRLFSKKIRYQVRKVNADRRPRMKGRFVKRPDLLQEAIDEESQ